MIGTLLKSMNQAKRVAALMATMSANQKRTIADKGLRPMVYPYTITAKLIQFPWTYNVKNVWLMRYWIYGWIVVYPLMVWIHFKVNSPTAKAAWEAKKKADWEKEHKQEWDI